MISAPSILRISVGVGERVEVRERLDVHAVGLPVEEQRVRLDRVEHRRRRALRDVHVHGAQVLGENRARRSVVGADVLEHRRVARLLGVMVDDEVDAVDEAAEVVRLHVDHRDAVVLLDRLRRDRLDVDVEQVDHPQVLRPRHALDRADDGRRLRAVQDVAQRQAAGQASGSGSLCSRISTRSASAKYRWYCCDPRARQRSAELGEQRPAEQLRHRQVRRRRETRAWSSSARLAVACAPRPTPRT